MDHASTIDEPFFMYDPIGQTQHDRVDGPGVQIMSIDNLPAELPLEASNHFSRCLAPFMHDLVLHFPRN
jgi:alpha-aminoadipic semialdehyde synthase